MATVSKPLKWHGGKHYLADRIISLIPPHTHYVEPYGTLTRDVELFTKTKWNGLILDEA
jgi:SNF2 family DNA or RNA helicase